MGNIKEKSYNFVYIMKIFDFKGYLLSMIT